MDFRDINMYPLAVFVDLDDFDARFIFPEGKRRSLEEIKLH